MQCCTPLAVAVVHCLDIKSVHMSKCQGFNQRFRQTCVPCCTTMTDAACCAAQRSGQRCACEWWRRQGYRWNCAVLIKAQVFTDLQSCAKVGADRMSVTVRAQHLLLHVTIVRGQQERLASCAMQSFSAVLFSETKCDMYLLLCICDINIWYSVLDVLAQHCTSAGQTTHRCENPQLSLVASILSEVVLCLFTGIQSNMWHLRYLPCCTSRYCSARTQLACCRSRQPSGVWMTGT